MPRGVKIALWGFGVVVWLWMGYADIAEAVRGGGAVWDNVSGAKAFFFLMFGPLCLGQLSRYVTAERKGNVLDPQFTLTSSESAVARVVPVFIMAAFLAVGLGGFWGQSLLADRPTPLYLSLLYVALGIIIGLGALLGPRTRLKLGPDGLEYSHVRSGKVGWQDIADVRISRMLISSWIVVTLKNSAEFRPAGWFARWRSATEILIYPSLFGLEAEVLKEGIEVRRNVFAF